MNGVTLKDNGDIMFDGELVGFLGWNNNMLVDIHIDKPYRSRGIATEAVSQMVDRIRSAGYDRIETTTVQNQSMVGVLRKNEFESRVVDEQIGEVNGEPITRERIEWYREL